MKRLVLAALAVALCGGAAAQDLKPFQFKQISTALRRDVALRAGLVERCVDTTIRGIPLKQCSTGKPVWSGGIAGFDSYGEFAYFDGQSLAMYDTAIRQSGIETVAAAFTQKYGAPCGVESSAIQNRLGATFDQRTTTWCFSDGKLTLSRYAERNLERAGIRFVADRFATRTPPTPNVNF